MLQFNSVHFNTIKPLISFFTILKNNSHSTILQLIKAICNIIRQLTFFVIRKNYNLIRSQQTSCSLSIFMSVTQCIIGILRL